MRTVKLLVAISCCVFCNCAVVEYFESEEPPYDKELSASYNRTKLKESTSADVLAIIHRPKYAELLSQSKSVVASQGQKKEGHKIWFNMVAFDENKLTAKRKYFFVVDEKGKAFLTGPRRSLGFDSEMVLGPDVLEEPYADESSRRIAILQRVLSNVREDINEVAQDNKKLDICGMMINQTLRTAIQKMDASPVLAANLSQPDGVAIDHISLGKGNIRMDVVDDIVSVNVRVGSLAWTHEDPFALEE